MPVIPALGRLRQEDHVFHTSLGCIERPCLNQLKANKQKNLNLFMNCINFYILAKLKKKKQLSLSVNIYLMSV
jgi:hypothetical protein